MRGMLLWDGFMASNYIFQSIEKEKCGDFL
jgi:hypothetical protein